MPVFAGNNPAGGHICRLLRFPVNNAEFIGAFTGKLLDLIEPEAWDDRLGTLTADAAAKLAKDIINEYLESNVCMVGEIKMFSRDTLPDGVLPCDGGVYFRVDYPDLYDVLPASLKINADTFQVPDLRDQFVRATGSNPLLAAGGSETHNLTVDEMPIHSHTTVPHTHTYTAALASVTSIAPGVPEPTAVPLPEITSPATVTVNSTGGGLPHNNVPPFIALVFGIQAR